MILSHVVSYSGYAVGGLALVLAADIGMQVVAPQPEPRVLTLAKFEYKPANGDRPATFTQQVISESGATISARWTAEISRTVEGITRQLCAGSGVAPYAGTVDTYDADEWTGDVCPDLRPGDRAEATWEYVNHYGVTASLSTTFVIP